MNEGGKKRKALLITVLVIGVLLTVYRIALFVRVPYYAIGDAGFDDAYLFNAADSILDGKWLGEYNYTTLIKGVSFPLFIALANLIGCSYSFLLGVFYVAASLVFCLAVRHICKNEIALLLIYLLSLYNPVGFSLTVSQRLYRNAIVYPAVLLVLSLILMVYYSRKESFVRQLIRMVLLGIIFCFTYYIREDSIWMVPLLGASLVFTGIWFLFFSGYRVRTRILRTLALVIPVLIFFGGNAIYSYVNYENYGVWEINDRTGGSFAEMTGNMMKIQDGSEPGSDYWITRETLEKVIECCPSLKKEEKTLLSFYDGWCYEGDNGNARGDMSVWAIRSALAESGYYENASKIETFCAAVNSEIEDAVSEGKLTYDDAIHFTTQSKGVQRSDITGYLKETVQNMVKVILYRYIDAEPGIVDSSGSKANIDRMEAIAAVQTVQKSDSKVTCCGWIILKDEDATLEVVNEDGEYLSEVELLERQDVASSHPDYKTALNSGFEFVLSGIEDESDLYFAICKDGKVLDTLPLSNTEDDHAILVVDKLETADGTFEIYSERVIAIEKTIMRFYTLISKCLLIAAFLFFILALAGFVRTRTWDTFEPLIIVPGIGLSILLLEFGVTVFNSWLSQIWFYSPGVLPLSMAAEVLCLIYGIRAARKFFTTDRQD